MHDGRGAGRSRPCSGPSRPMRSASRSRTSTCCATSAPRFVEPGRRRGTGDRRPAGHPREPALGPPQLPEQPRQHRARRRAGPAIEEAGLFKAAGGGTIVDAGSIGIAARPARARAGSRGDRAARRRRHRLLHLGLPPALDWTPGGGRAGRGDRPRPARRDRATPAFGPGSSARSAARGRSTPNERKSLRAAGPRPARDRARRSRSTRVATRPRRSRSSRSSPPRGRTRRASSWATSSGPSSSRETWPASPGRAAIVELDWFGEVLSMYPTGPVNVPSDTERIDQIRMLIRRRSRRAGPRVARRLPQDPARALRRQRLRPPPARRDEWMRPRACRPPR